MDAAPARPSDADLHRDAQALHAALGQLLRVYQFRDRDQICCHDLSVTQWYALDVLLDSGPLRSHALARDLLLDKSTTTRVVDTLVRKGYVERRPDPNDARAVSLSATAAGRRLYRRIERSRIRQQVELIRDLAPDVRRGAAELLLRLTQAAEARFAPNPGVETPEAKCSGRQAHRHS
jgi:MarR family 2-MHQ and catechol resistance regulon transcriptional repressor